NELEPKGLFFLQGFFWPLTAQTAWIQANIGIPGGITVATIGLLDLTVIALVAVVAVYAFASWRTRRFELLAIPVTGVAIGVAASAPSLWRLSWAYVENSPRLLYLVAIGASIFWGLLPALEFAHTRVTWAWRSVTIVLVLVIVAQSLRFIDLRLEMLDTGTATIDEIVELGERYDEQSVLVMNAPSWFAQGSYEYPYGHFGVQLMPSYIGLDRVIYTSSRRSAEVSAASGTFDAKTSAGPYSFGPHGVDLTLDQIDVLLRDGRTLINVWPVNGAYQVREVGRLLAGQAEPELPEAGRFNEDIEIDDARVAVVDGLLTVYVDLHVLDRTEHDVERSLEL
ncbi:MAG: hypothetical protein ACRD1H_10050, partial [Vicinamibacterales bacterium]